MFEVKDVMAPYMIWLLPLLALAVGCMPESKEKELPVDMAIMQPDVSRALNFGEPDMEVPVDKGMADMSVPEDAASDSDAVVVAAADASTDGAAPKMDAAAECMRNFECNDNNLPQLAVKGLSGFPEGGMITEKMFWKRCGR